MRTTALSVVALSAACASPSRKLDERQYPGVLRDVSSLGLDVLWRQRIEAEWGDGERRGFDGVVQKQDRRLTILGLSPLGTPGFSIVLEDGDVRLQARSPERIPFPPRFVVLDVQRVFFPWLAGVLADGVRDGVVDGERVSERWRGGRLVQREFERMDGEPSGRITIAYRWDLARHDHAWAVPPRVELDSAWFGYRLVIETLEEARLDERP